MPQGYKVDAVYQKAVWDNDANKGDYPADLAGFDQGPVLLFHDSTSDFDPPKVGDDVFGDIEKDKRGQWRLKRKARPKAGGGKGGYSPADIARMSRAHSQQMALLFIHATGDAKDLNLEDEQVVGAYLNGTFDRLAGWFGRDVDRAEEAVLKAAPAPAANGGGEVPADTRELQPAAAAKSDDDIPF